MKQDVIVNRKHKDRLFRFIFNNPKELLSLYNAMNGTDYQNPDELIINTMEDVIYLSMKNDVSFVIRGILNLYEHQSTWNPNMPFRNLIYVGDLLKGYVAENDFDIYGSRPIILPTPIAIVFYNGLEDRPERSVLKLSDLYEVKGKKGCLEFETLVLNINYGNNKELMEKCQTLMEYSLFIDRIKKCKTLSVTMEEAVKQAINECIKDNILKDILIKHRNEVFNMILTEYDEQAHIEKERDWSRQEGLEEGITVGEQRITDLYRYLIKDDRMEDMKKATEDKKFQEELLEEYKL